jgi:hypothetical protein
LLIIVFSDLFRDHELSGWAKALWVIFVIIFPFLGIFVYLIARGGGMAKRAAAAQAQMDQQMRQYVQQAAAATPGASASTADELAKLADLREKGVISEEEFQSLKAKAITT